MRNARLVGGLAALAVLLILLLAPAAWAAPLPLVSSTSYASAGDDGFTCVTTGPDGAVYAAGYAQQNAALTSGVLLLVKYVDDGSKLTEAWHVLAGYEPMTAVKVAVNSYGDVIVAANRGRGDFHGNGGDIVVEKVSPAGEPLWTSEYDGRAHGLDYVKAMTLDRDGNVIVCGSSFDKGTGRDYVTIKFTSGGGRAWVRKYAGPSDFDEARDVTVDPAGNVYVTGQSRMKSPIPGRSGLPRAVTISYAPGGRQRWIVVDKRKHSTSGVTLDYCGVAGAKGVVLSGSRWPLHARYEHLYFDKYRSSDGHVVWTSTVNTTARVTEWPSAAALDASGAPIVAGGSNAQGGIEALLAGVSANGLQPWSSYITSITDNPAWAEFADVAVASDGRILAAGQTATAAMPEEGDQPTAFLVRSSTGWPVTAPLDYIGDGGPTTYDACKAVAIGDRGMYAVGKAAEGSGDTDAVLLKF